MTMSLSVNPRRWTPPCIAAPDAPGHFFMSFSRLTLV